MKISIGCDHAAFEHKDYIIQMLEKEGHELINRGTDGPNSVDYPDFAHVVCEDVESKVADFGILLCGSANGMAMSANKHPGIRAGLCWLPEVGELVKQHNNANVIALPARFISKELAVEITFAYMNTSFEGGRHERRVDKIPC